MPTGIFHHKKNPEKKSVFVCDWCKKEFTEWTYRQPRFCSNQCRSEFAAKQPRGHTKQPSRGGKVIWYCEQCGREMHTFKSRVRTYCSPKCWGKSVFGKSKGVYGSAKKNTSYRGENWQSQREKVRKRDGYRCQICGEPSLDVHHIRKYRLFDGDWKSANDLSNLVTLCELHHSQVEHNIIPCPIPKW